MTVEARHRSPGSTSARALGLTLQLERLPAVRAGLQSEGVSNWARRHRFTPKAVFEVLSGKRPCVRGTSHDIAVALGLKDHAEKVR